MGPLEWEPAVVRESIWRRNGSFLGTDAEIGTVQQVVKGHARRRRIHLTKRGEAVGWSVLWVAVAALVVLPYMHSYRHLSPLDEMVHVDYLVKMQDGHLVRGGELSGETAMRAQACRGHDLKDFPGPPCTAKVLRAEQFPFGGYNTAYADPPVYYVVTAAGAGVLDQLPGVHDIVTEGRAIGVLWLGAGLALTFLLALRLGANRWSAAGATLLVASTPGVAHAMATITSDAPSLLVGAGLCLVAVAFVRGRASWWWLAPAAAATTAVKATGLTVVGLVAVFLLLHLLRSVPDRISRAADEGVPAADVSVGPDDPDLPAPLPRRTIWLATAATVLPALAMLGLWSVFNALTDLPEAADVPMRQYLHADSIGWDQLSGNFLKLTSPLQEGYLPPFMHPVTLTFAMSLVNLAFVVGAAALALNGRRGSVQTRMAVASVVAMLLGAVGLVVLVFVGSHSYTPIPPRYGLSLVPALAACLAVVVSQRRAGGYVLTGLGSVALLALLTQTL